VRHPPRRTPLLEAVRQFVAAKGDQGDKVELVWRRVGPWLTGEPNAPASAVRIDAATGQLTVREHVIDLPEPGADLISVANLSARALRSFTLTDHECPGLETEGLDLIRRKITGLTAPEARFENARIEDVAFTGCDLTRSVFIDTELTRVRFTDCTLSLASFELVHAAHVIFENCRIGGTQFDVLITNGPLAFVLSDLREAAFTACKLGHAVIHECDLQLTEFDAQGDYDALDLRGNDVAALLGITNLHRATVSLTQARAMAATLISHVGLHNHDDPAEDTASK
jgi:uncharacterized protein YjbI with pentapeptide repeats